MKRKLRGLITGAILITVVFGSLSCKKMFDLQPEDALGIDQAYRNVYDADAAVIGIYGKVMNIADRYMILNELRGDLEEVTPNADKFLKQISNHQVTADNPWANPKPFYEIIINCNDALKNFDLMLKDKRLSQADYNIRYSEIGAMRSWIYLQVGIHYGTVPYVTEALENVQDLKDESKFQRIPFEQLLEKLIQFTEALPSKQPMPAGTSLLSALDSYNTSRMFVNKFLLLGDLHLWKGNYSQAAAYYKTMMEYSDVLYPSKDTEFYFNTFNIGGNQSQLSGNNWSRIFAGSFGERFSNYENIWMLPFDKKFSPSNPFIKLYAPESEYLIKPSVLSEKNWNDETRGDDSPVDVNRGNGRSYLRINSQPQVYKLIMGYTSLAQPFDKFATTGKWIVYRTALLHLRMAETANRDGRDKLASALLNSGIRRTFTPKRLPLSVNVSDIMQSKDVDPNYYFDGRQGDNPRFRQKYSYNEGIRGRVGLKEALVDSSLYFNMQDKGSENKPVTNRLGLTVAMEDLLMNEAARELAYEGNRWPDLIRIALRREKEAPGSGKLFLKNTIAKKYIAANLQVPAEVEKLGADINSWYLPFKWQ